MEMEVEQRLLKVFYLGSPAEGPIAHNPRRNMALGFGHSCRTEIKPGFLNLN
jgi:hypothetical protein